MSEFRELVLGGTPKHTRNWSDRAGDNKFKNPTFVDIVPQEGGIVWDLNVHPLPFADNTFDEIHAYQILEHLGTQGDYKFFFREFNEYWRILKPNGLMYIAVPLWDKIWAWGDPGHTRVLPNTIFNFLDPLMYEAGLYNTTISDYRAELGLCNFKYITDRTDGTTILIKLKAIKHV